MAAARQGWPAGLLHFWFHKLTPRQRFARDDAVDAELRRRFSRTLRALGGRSPAHFLTDPTTARAAVLLFDQLPRNLERGSARAFAHDAKARAIALGAIRRGWDRGLDKAGRQFLYMPLMHSESRAEQLRSLRLYAALGDPFIFGFARRHAAMVLRFGRFPHRNATLDRTSTPAETRAVTAGNAW